MTKTEKITTAVIVGLLVIGFILGILTSEARALPQSRPVATHAMSGEPIDLSGVNWTDLARLVYGRCGEWHDLAMMVGWSEAQWPKLSYVMYRESRCNISTINKSDPNGGSRGLMQINGYWCKKNKYNPTGWLQAQGILTNCNDLFNPEINLRAGLAMWNYSQQKNKCGWKPWATRC